MALIERARAGVRVIVLFDEVGSSGLPDAYVEDLREAGAQVSSFKPTRGRGNRFQLNFRNHRKMVVIDGGLGWIGGHNVGDEYLGLDPEFSPWRDTHVRIEGPAVLQLAALRGVDVRIITTGKGDSLPVYLAAFHYIHALRGLDIRFYAYSPGFMHQKVMLVDEHTSVVGTHNFDNRSFRLNFEVASIVVDDAFARDMQAMFERDFAHAEPINPDTWDERPLWWRIGVRLSRLASPVL